MSNDGKVPVTHDGPFLSPLLSDEAREQIGYPTSPHEWMSVKAVEERDAEIEELEAEVERLKDLERRQSRRWNATVEWLNWEGHESKMSGRELATYLLDVILDPAWDYEAYLQEHPGRDWANWKQPT